MNNGLWIITPHFNPIGYKTIDQNLEIFSKRILSQGANLCIIKLHFPYDGRGFSVRVISENHLEIHTSADSIIWHKESLINLAIKVLHRSKAIAWIDGDVLFPDGWLELAEEKLDKNEVVQLFKKVYHLEKDETSYGGKTISSIQSIIWQNKIHKNWLSRRLNKELPFAAPGFAWAARTDFLKKICGLYPRAITGSSDVIFADALLGSQDLHVYHSILTECMKKDVELYKDRIRFLHPQFDYLPIDIYHLWHGTFANRRYIDRHQILVNSNYNPLTDLNFEEQTQVYELAGNKTGLEEELKDYFINRKDDELENKPKRESLIQKMFKRIRFRIVRILRWIIWKLYPPGY
jgi:hypothetical protein